MYSLSLTHTHVHFILHDSLIVFLLLYLFFLIPQHTKYQLLSLAMRSHVATQTVYASCESTELVGANGKIFPVNESSDTLLHKITVEDNNMKDCKVSHVTCHVMSHIGHVS